MPADGLVELRSVDLPESGWIREGDAVFELTLLCGALPEGALVARTEPAAAVVVDGLRIRVTPDGEGVYVVHAVVGERALEPARFGYDATPPTVESSAPALVASENPLEWPIHARAEHFRLEVDARDGGSGVRTAQWSLGPFEEVVVADLAGLPLVGAERLRVVLFALQFTLVDAGPRVASSVARDVAGNEVQLDENLHVADFAYGARVLAPRYLFETREDLESAARTLSSRRNGLASRFGDGVEDALPWLERVGERLGRVLWSDLELAGQDLADDPRVGFRGVALAADLRLLENIAGDLEDALEDGNWAAAEPLARRGAFVYGLVRDGWHLDWNRPFPVFAPDAVRAEMLAIISFLEVALEDLRFFFDEDLPFVVSQLHRVFADVIQDGWDGDQWFINALFVSRDVAQLAAESRRFVDEISWLAALVQFWVIDAMDAQAIALRGAGRQDWPIHVACGLTRMDARRLLDDRDLSGLNALFDNLDRVCPCMGVYHCAYLDNGGQEDRDRAVELRNECWEVLYRPAEWAQQPVVDGIPPQCQLRADDD